MSGGLWETLKGSFGKGKKEAEAQEFQNAEEPLPIAVETLRPDSVSEAALVEVTDHRILAQIDQLIPGLAKAGSAAARAASSKGEVL